MSTIIVDRQVVQIPEGISDLEAFLRWAHSEEFPETGRVCYLNGELWVDMSEEGFFSHNQIKGEYNRVLGGIAKAEHLGRYVPDGMLLTNAEANLTSQPDGAFISHQSLRIGRVQLVEGTYEGFLELQGSPDMVLEVVSSSSVEKDTITLRELYWQAGIREYWLVDAREAQLIFDILRLTAKGYAATPKQRGWLKSAVFGKSFRLTQKQDELGHPEYTLEVR